MKLRHVFVVIAIWLFPLILSGCAGIQRDWTSCVASDITGADWVVLQYGYNGAPINCWKLHGVGISNEGGSDGIFWNDTSTGHLVHISGWYNRVQVRNQNFKEAARLLGVDSDLCGNGKYPDKSEK